jgi:hypothetical protein
MHMNTVNIHFPMLHASVLRIGNCAVGFFVIVLDWLLTTYGQCLNFHSWRLSTLLESYVLGMLVLLLCPTLKEKYIGFHKRMSKDNVSKIRRLRRKSFLVWLCVIFSAYTCCTRGVNCVYMIRHSESTKKEGQMKSEYLMGVIRRMFIFWDLALCSLAAVRVNASYQTTRYYVPEDSSLRRRTTRLGGSNTLVSNWRMYI